MQTTGTPVELARSTIASSASNRAVFDEATRYLRRGTPRHRIAIIALERRVVANAAAKVSWSMADADPTSPSNRAADHPCFDVHASCPPPVFRRDGSFVLLTVTAR